MTQKRFRRTDFTPYEFHRDRIGQLFLVLRHLADDERDPNIGTLHRIRFDAWPEEVEQGLFVLPHAETQFGQLEPLWVGRAEIHESPHDPHALLPVDGHLLAAMSDNGSAAWAGITPRLAAALNFCQGIPTEVLLAAARGDAPLQAGHDAPSGWSTVGDLVDQVLESMGDVFYDADAFREDIECESCGRWITAREWSGWGEDPATHVCPECGTWVGTPNERQRRNVKATLVRGFAQLLATSRGEIPDPDDESV